MNKNLPFKGSETEKVCVWYGHTKCLSISYVHNWHGEKQSTANAICKNEDGVNKGQVVMMMDLIQNSSHCLALNKLLSRALCPRLGNLIKCNIRLWGHFLSILDKYEWFDIFGFLINEMAFMFVLWKIVIKLCCDSWAPLLCSHLMSSIDFSRTFCKHNCNHVSSTSDPIIGYIMFSFINHHLLDVP